jgi:hypothetical protein
LAARTSSAPLPAHSPNRPADPLHQEARHNTGAS